MANIETIYEKIERKDLNLSEEELVILQNYPEYCLDYLKAIDFKIIPEKLLEGIEKDWLTAYFFLLNAHNNKIDILNYPKLIELVAKNSLAYSEFILKILNYHNIPECLIERFKNSRLMEKENIHKCVIEHERKKKLEKLLK